MIGRLIRSSNPTNVVVTHVNGDFTWICPGEMVLIINCDYVYALLMLPDGSQIKVGSKVSWIQDVQ